MVRTWGVFSFLTWKCASCHNSVQFFISHLARWPRTRRFSEPTFRPSWATNQWKNALNRDFPTFSRTCLFFLLTLSPLWSSHCFSSPLWLFPPLLFLLSILSEVWLLSFLRLCPYDSLRREFWIIYTHIINIHWRMLPFYIDEFLITHFFFALELSRWCRRFANHRRGEACHRYHRRPSVRLEMPIKTYYTGNGDSWGFEHGTNGYDMIWRIYICISLLWDKHPFYRYSGVHEGTWLPIAMWGTANYCKRWISFITLPSRGKRLAWVRVPAAEFFIFSPSKRISCTCPTPPDTCPDTCLANRDFGMHRHRRDSNPCGQNPVDF